MIPNAHMPETAAVTERPIILNAEAVQAILKGRKTQERRVVEPQPHKSTAYYLALLCPFGVPGDRLWLRGPTTRPPWAERITLELTAVRVERLQDISEADAIAEGYTRSAVEDDGSPLGAALAGGVWTAKFNFMFAWDHRNAKRGFGWTDNPWVWVLEWRRS
jgi:hypothetical protein